MSYPDGTAYPVIPLGTQAVPVANQSELTSKLASVQPGQRLVLGQGTYSSLTVTGKSGTATSGISIEAQAVGGPLFTGTATIKDCAYLTVKGLAFPQDPEGDTFQFRGSSHHCKLTRTRIGPNAHPGSALTGEAGTYVFVGDDCHDLDIGYNELQNKARAGNGIRVYGNFSTYKACLRVRIHHNDIHDFHPAVVNDFEPIRYGVSTMSRTDTYGVIERNVLTNIRSEPELISGKTGSLRISGNVALRCSGSMVIRHGRNCVMTDNYAIDRASTSNTNGEGSGGYRYYDSGHDVSRNYADGLIGTKYQTPLLLDSGDVEGSSTSLSSHFRVVDSTVVGNVIVDCPEGIGIGNNYKLAPSGCTITDNVALRVASGTAITQRIAPVSSTLSNNQYFATPAAGGFAQDADGIWRKAGVGPRLTYLKRSDVGPAGDLSESDGTGALVDGSSTPTPGTFSVSAGADAQVLPSVAFTRTATESGSATVSARSWSIVSAPTGTGATPDQTVAAEKFGWGQPLASSDDFAYSGAPSPTKWSVYEGEGHADNGVRSPARVTVDGSKMVLTGLAGSANTAGLSHKTAQTFGRWEVRLRSSATGTGTNNYHVLLTLWPEDDAWPEGGEIDFVELGTPGQSSAEAYWHYPSLDGEDSKLHFTKLAVDTSQWHNYAVEWSSSGIVAYVDGVEWARASGGATSARRAIQDPPGPWQLTVQLDATHPDGYRAAQMELDWARVYPIVPVGSGTGTGGGASQVGQVLSSAAALSWTPTVVGTYVLRYSATTAAGVVFDDVTVTVTTTPDTGPPPDPGTGGGGTGVDVLAPDSILGGELFGVPTIERVSYAGRERPTLPGSGLFPGPLTFPSTSAVASTSRTGWATYPGPVTFPGVDLFPGWGALTGPPPPFDVEFFLLEADGGYRCALPDVVDFTISPIGNSAGSVSLTYPVTGRNFDALLEHVEADRDAKVAVHIAGSADGVRHALLMEASGDDAAESGTWDFSGHFGEIRFGEVPVLPQASDDGKLAFVNATAGEVVTTLVAQAQLQGVLSDVDTGSFDASNDSQGAPWSKRVESLTLAPGATYSRVLDQLRSAGLCEWTMDGSSLRLYEAGGRGFDRTVGRSVVLRGGRNVVSASRRHSVRDAVTALLVTGADGSYALVSDPVAEARRGRRILGTASQGGLSGGALQAYAQVQLELQSRGASEYTQQLVFDDASPLPGRDFDIGDWVWSDTDGVRRRLRVAQWTITGGDRGLSGSVSLNDLIADRLLRLAQQVAGIGDGSIVLAGSASQATDSAVPSAPTGLVADSRSVPQPDGSSVCQLSARWDPVVTAVDGTSSVEVTGYRLRWRYVVPAGSSSPVPLVGEWQVLDDLGLNLSTEIDGVLSGARVEVQVAAFGAVAPPPVVEVPTPDPVVPAATQAAQLILTRLNSGLEIFEDWTWADSPALVDEHSEALLAAAAASGLSGDNWPTSAAAKTWLRSYILANGGSLDGTEPPPGTGGGGSSNAVYPADVIDLTNWKVTLPYTEGGKVKEVKPPALATFTDQYFQLTDAKDGIRFRVFHGGDTTQNSKNPRSELRERYNNDPEGYWNPTSGTHALTVVGQVNRLTKVKPHVVLWQIHGGDDDATVFRLEGSSLYITKGDTTHAKLVTSSFALGQRYTLKGECKNGVMSYWYNGTKVDYSLTISDTSAYFKAGNYLQSNPTSAPSESKSEYCEVVIYSVQVTHS